MPIMKKNSMVKDGLLFSAGLFFNLAIVALTILIIFLLTGDIKKDKWLMLDSNGHGIPVSTVLMGAITSICIILNGVFTIIGKKISKNKRTYVSFYHGQIAALITVLIPAIPIIILCILALMFPLPGDFVL
jgi:hypothetical protein